MRLLRLNWALAYVPFGLITGFFTVTYVLKISNDGLTTREIALILAGPTLMNWGKWIWAPLVDLWPNRKHIYMATNFGATAIALVMFYIPASNQHLLMIAIGVSLAYFLNSMTGMSVEALVAQIQDPKRLRASTVWMQGGGLLGSGLGGSIGMFAIHASGGNFIIVASLFAGTAIFANFALARLPHTRGPRAVPVITGKAIIDLLRDALKVFTSAEGKLVAVLCLLPLSTGAAATILTQTPVARAWHMDLAQVALFQGLIAGFLTPVGSFFVAPLLKYFRATSLYALAGFGLALLTLTMSIVSFTPLHYEICAIVYATLMGLGYGAFSAMVISVVGRRSAASGYNFFSSLANFPILLTTLLLGYATERYSSSTMLVTESILGIASCLLFVVARVRASSNETFRAAERKYA